MCKDCSHCIGEEFRPESLSLHHTNSSEFVRSQVSVISYIFFSLALFSYFDKNEYLFIEFCFT